MTSGPRDDVGSGSASSSEAAKSEHALTGLQATVIRALRTGQRFQTLTQVYATFRADEARPRGAYRLTLALALLDLQAVDLVTIDKRGEKPRYACTTFGAAALARYEA